MGRASWILCLGLILGGCGGGGGSGGGAPLLDPIADLTGSWFYSEACDRADCGEGVVVDEYAIEITQNGNSLVVNTPYGLFFGTISGNNASWDGSRFDGNGVRAFTVTLIVASDGNTMVGLDDWNWLGNDTSFCTGTCDVDSVRQGGTPASVDLDGAWISLETCDETCLGGGLNIFTAAYILTQFGSIITVDTPVGSFEGEVNGSEATWSGSYSRDGGTYSFTATVTIAGNELSFLGVSDWMWSDGAITCTGTCTLEALRGTGPPGSPFLMEGFWTQTRNCDESECGGPGSVLDTFPVAVDQLFETILLETPEGSSFGYVSGDFAFWSGSRRKSGGIETYTAVVALDPGGASYSGQKDWYFDDGVTSCRGSCALFGEIDCPEVILGPALPVVFPGTTVNSSNNFDPSCAAGGTAPDFTFKWQAPFSGIFRIDTLGSSFDTVLTILDGTCDGNLVGCNDNGPVGFTSELTIGIGVGAEIIIVVDGVGASSGSFNLRIFDLP
ncbi:MAG: hypothetical protein V3T77_09335 [Planctomycetota bacterium]